MSQVSKGRSEPAPPGLTVVQTDAEHDDWLITVRRMRRGEVEHDDSNQPREPAGSPRGGQWTSSGGGGGGGAARSSALTEAQRAGIRATGTAAVMESLQRKLVQRYGVPAKQAALMYERDIKQQLKAAKAQRAELFAHKRALERRGGEALDKSLEALRKTVREHDERQVRNAQVHKEYLAKGAAQEAARRKAAAAKGAATRAANKAKREAEAKAAAAKAANPHADVDAHEAALKGTYGGAARTVAWGKAMVDRGKAMAIDDFHAGTASLSALGIVHSSFDHSSALRNVREANPHLKTVAEHAAAIRADNPGATGEEIASRLEGSAAIVAHRQALEASGGVRTDPIKLTKPLRWTKKANTSRHDAEGGLEDARKHYDALAHRDIKQPTDYVWQANKQYRGDCQTKSIGFREDKINLGTGRYRDRDAVARVAMHEWGHAIESDNPKLKAAAHAFYEARTKGEPLTHLGKGYKKHEMTRKDKFDDGAYMGKEYISRTGDRYATELTSMGAERLHSAWHWADLHRKDPDTAAFTLGQLAHQ